MLRSSSHVRPDFPPRKRHRVLRDVLNIRVIHVRPPAPEDFIPLPLASIAQKRPRRNLPRMV